MKVIVLYGPGEVGKRSFLLKIKKSFLENAVTTVDFKQAGLEKLNLLISSTPLFLESERLIIAENVGDETDLNKVSGASDLTLLLVALQPKATSKLLKSAKETGAMLTPFEAEKELSAFLFLDNLLEQKQSALLELKKLLSEYGAMYLLSMVFYALRRNILPLPQSSFMEGKIKAQKQKYEDSEWEKLYRLALVAEYNIKSGNSLEEIELVRLTEAIVLQRYR